MTCPSDSSSPAAMTLSPSSATAAITPGAENAAATLSAVHDFHPSAAHRCAMASACSGSKAATTGATFGVSHSRIRLPRSAISLRVSHGSRKKNNDGDAVTDRYERTDDRDLIGHALNLLSWPAKL